MSTHKIFDDSNSSSSIILSEFSNQRKRFTIGLVLLGVVALCLLISTIVLGVKVYKEEEDSYPLAKINMIVWDDPISVAATKTNLLVKAPNNATLFTAMEHAALMNPTHQFEYTQYVFGKYVTSVGGKNEVPGENLFWMIYKLSKIPDASNPPNEEMIPDKGIDELRVRTGDVYLFWLAKVTDHMQKVNYRI